MFHSWWISVISFSSDEWTKCQNIYGPLRNEINWWEEMLWNISFRWNFIHSRMLYTSHTSYEWYVRYFWIFTSNWLNWNEKENLDYLLWFINNNNLSINFRSCTWLWGDLLLLILMVFFTFSYLSIYIHSV